MPSNPEIRIRNVMGLNCLKMRLRPDWEIERKESYQYFSRLRLEEIMRNMGYMIIKEELQIEQWEHWQQIVRIVEGTCPFENITMFCVKV